MRPTKLGLLGATGKMGCLLLKAAEQDPSFSNPCQIGPKQTPEYAFEGTDVVVDFSNASVTQHHLALAKRFQKPFLLGTTGLSPETQGHLQQVSKDIPLLWAPNSSLSMAIFKQSAINLEKALGTSYDVEIVEAHHRFKQDKPSGTALMLQAALTQHGSRSTIPISALRAGNLPGEHTIHWISDTDSITLSHKAFNREGFVQGALRAAKWLVTQPPGIHTMEEAFGL